MSTTEQTAQQYTAQQIRAARVQHLGMTQRELSLALGVEQASVSRWERGVTEPSPRWIREIAKLARLPVNWFYPSEVAA